MYSIHGLVNGEASPLVICLMVNKHQVRCCSVFKIEIKWKSILFQGLYQQVFAIIRQELETRFGSVGAVQNSIVHFDFESVAMNAFGQVFPNVTVKSCLFHLAKAVQWKLDDG